MESHSHWIKITCPVGNIVGNLGVVLESVDIDNSREIPVIRIRGALDLSSAPAVYQRFLEILSEGITEINFDLSDVDLIDWAGLGIIAGALWRMRSQKGDIAISGMSTVVADALEVSRLVEII